MRSPFSGTNSENYGRGVVELDVDPSDFQSHAEEVSARLRATFNASTYTPPVLPAAAMDVHRLSQMPNVKFEQVLATLEKDPLLAARVLRVAGSPVYGGAPLQSLHTAVMRLGLKNLGTIVWEVALNMRVFRSKAYTAPMDLIRKHSTAVAHVARAVAKHTSVPLDYAFLCGLLHDVGAAAALLLLDEGGSNTQGTPLKGDVLDLVLDKAHAEASQLVAKLWALPVDVQLVLGAHHDVLMGGYPHPTAAIVAIAESLVSDSGSEVGIAPLAWDGTRDTALLAARSALSLDARALDALHAETLTILKNLEHP